MSHVVEFRLDGADKVLEQLGRVSSNLAAQGLSNAVAAGAKYLESAVKLNIREVQNGGHKGLIDTGNYINSWGSRVTRADANSAEAEVTTNVVYGPIHEFGGTIVPRNARALAIPRTAEARKVGSPRNMPELVFVRVRSGQMFLMDAAGRIQYVLVGAVRIPARPHVRPAFDENVDQVSRIVADTVSRTIEGALR